MISIIMRLERILTNTSIKLTKYHVRLVRLVLFSRGQVTNKISVYLSCDKDFIALATKGIQGYIFFLISWRKHIVGTQQMCLTETYAIGTH